MSDQVESGEQGQPGATDESGARPGPAPDPVARALADVDEAMAEARAGVPGADDVPTVPSDDEVAGLEHAHEALRSTLDRVERGG